MEEISILEYLKLNIKKKGNWLRIPGFIFISDKQGVKKKSFISDRLSDNPLKLILAVLFAILAQSQLEPPNRNIIFATMFYCLAGALFFLEIRYSKVETKSRKKIISNQRIRFIPFVLSLFLILFSFWAFKNNTFNLLNISLWSSAIILFVYSVWEKRINTSKRGFRFDIWILGFFVIIGIVLFFRLFQLFSIPGEMFSDHAEKLLDILDILHGKTPIFFTRNTGRESFQFYLTFLIIKILGTGISFISLKIGTVICGLLTLPFIYLIAKEIGNRKIGILAFFMAGIAYWPNVISRIGLRYALYPLFVAPSLLYLIRGLRNNSRNDFVLSGIFLGIGLHGYSPIRILPFVIMIGSLLAILHTKIHKNRKQIIWNTTILMLTALLIFLPLFRYAIENPTMFSIRAISRVTSIEQPFSGPEWLIFVRNFWNALTMFFYSNGEIWVHSIPFRPALDIMTAASFFLGLVYLFKRYLINRDWVDLFILFCIPLLMLPSILSLAFPRENPSLNRTAGAIVPVFIISALGMGYSIQRIFKLLKTKNSRLGFTLFCVSLMLFMSISNFKLVFFDYNQQYKQNAWNTSEISAVINFFIQEGGNPNSVFVVPYPYWVDTRLVGINAGYPEKDYALWPDDFMATLEKQDRKLFVLNQNDQNSLLQLQNIYPESTWQIFVSRQVDKNFILLFTT